MVDIKSMAQTVEGVHSAANNRWANDKNRYKKAIAEYKENAQFRDADEDYSLVLEILEEERENPRIRKGMTQRDRIKVFESMLGDTIERDTQSLKGSGGKDYSYGIARDPNAVRGQESVVGELKKALQSKSKSEGESESGVSSSDIKISRSSSVSSDKSIDSGVGMGDNNSSIARDPNAVQDQESVVGELKKDWQSKNKKNSSLRKTGNLDTLLNRDAQTYRESSPKRVVELEQQRMQEQKKSESGSSDVGSESSRNTYNRFLQQETEDKQREQADRQSLPENFKKANEKIAGLSEVEALAQLGNMGMPYESLNDFNTAYRRVLNLQDQSTQTSEVDQVLQKSAPKKIRTPQTPSQTAERINTDQLSTAAVSRKPSSKTKRAPQHTSQTAERINTDQLSTAAVPRKPSSKETMAPQPPSQTAERINSATSHQTTQASQSNSPLHEMPFAGIDNKEFSKMHSNNLQVENRSIGNNPEQSVEGKNSEVHHVTLSVGNEKSLNSQIEEKNAIESVNSLTPEETEELYSKLRDDIVYQGKEEDSLQIAVVNGNKGLKKFETTDAMKEFVSVHGVIKESGKIDLELQMKKAVVVDVEQLKKIKKVGGKEVDSHIVNIDGNRARVVQRESGEVDYEVLTGIVDLTITDKNGKKVVVAMSSQGEVKVKSKDAEFDMQDPEVTKTMIKGRPLVDLMNGLKQDRQTELNSRKFDKEFPPKELSETASDLYDPKLDDDQPSKKDVEDSRAKVSDWLNLHASKSQVQRVQGQPLEKIDLHASKSQVQRVQGQPLVGLHVEDLKKGLSTRRAKMTGRNISDSSSKTSISTASITTKEGDIVQKKSNKVANVPINMDAMVREFKKQVLVMNIIPVETQVAVAKLGGNIISPGNLDRGDLIRTVEERYKEMKTNPEKYTAELQEFQKNLNDILQENAQGIQQRSPATVSSNQPLNPRKSNLGSSEEVIAELQGRMKQKNEESSVDNAQLTQTAEEIKQATDVKDNESLFTTSVAGPGQSCKTQVPKPDGQDYNKYRKSGHAL